jgi:hypothetical protein
MLEKSAQKVVGVVLMFMTVAMMMVVVAVAVLMMFVVVMVPSVDSGRCCSRADLQFQPGRSHQVC